MSTYADRAAIESDRPLELTVDLSDVLASRPAACWSVQNGDWDADLPEDVAALLAPPVVVSASAAGGSFAATPDRAVGVAAAPVPATAATPRATNSRFGAGQPYTPRFISPAPPLPQRRRRVPVL